MVPTLVHDPEFWGVLPRNANQLCTPRSLGSHEQLDSTSIWILWCTRVTKGHYKLNKNLHDFQNQDSDIFGVRKALSASLQWRSSAGILGSSTAEQGLLTGKAAKNALDDVVFKENTKKSADSLVQRLKASWKYIILQQKRNQIIFIAHRKHKNKHANKHANIKYLRKWKKRSTSKAFQSATTIRTSEYLHKPSLTSRLRQLTWKSEAERPSQSTQKPTLDNFIGHEQPSQTSLCRYSDSQSLNGCGSETLVPE